MGGGEEEEPEAPATQHIHVTAYSSARMLLFSLLLRGAAAEE